MPYMGIPTAGERDALSTQLAFLYLEKSDISGLTPTELAKKYFEVKDEIHSVVSEQEVL